MKDLSVGNERKLILNFALPMLLGNVFQQLYNIVDSVIIGNYLGKEALAAVGASFPVIFALISFVIGIATGSTIIIAQYFGAKRFDKVKVAIDTLFVFMFFAAIIISFVGIFFAEEIFKMMSLPEEVIPAAKSYFVIYSLGYIFFFGYNGTGAVLRGLGDSKTPLYFLILATIVNIILDYLFLVAFDWGIEGVAWATIIAQGGAFFTLVLYLNKYQKKGIVKLSLLNLKFDMQMFKDSARIGFPSGVQNTVVALGMIALFSIVNSFGTVTAAAYSVVMRIDSFASLPAMNFAAALSTFVGQNLGANKPERLRNGLKSTFVMTGLVAVLVSFVAWTASDFLMRMFTSDAEVIRVGSEYLVIVCSFYIVFSALFVLNGFLRGAGETMIPMLITLFAMWVIRIPAAYILAHFFGVTGLWWSMPTGWIIGLFFSYIYYKSNKWKGKAVTQQRQVKIDQEGLVDLDQSIG